MTPFFVTARQGILWIAILSCGTDLALRLVPAPRAAGLAPAEQHRVAGARPEVACAPTPSDLKWPDDDLPREDLLLPI
jgi:hypothetical protein